MQIARVSINATCVLPPFMRIERDQNGRLKLRRNSGVKKVVALAVAVLFVGVCGISVVTAAEMNGESAQQKLGIDNGDGIPNPDCPNPDCPDPNPDCPNT